MTMPSHKVRYGLRGLEVNRVEEDGTTITVRITPLATMEYLSTRPESGENLRKRRLPPKWLLKLLIQAHRKKFTEFFFWATFLVNPLK